MKSSAEIRQELADLERSSPLAIKQRELVEAEARERAAAEAEAAARERTAAAVRAKRVRELRGWDAVVTFESSLAAFNEAYAAARDVLVTLGVEGGDWALRRDRVEDSMLVVAADFLAPRWSGPQYTAVWESRSSRQSQALSEKFEGVLR